MVSDDRESVITLRLTGMSLWLVITIQTLRRNVRVQSDEQNAVQCLLVGCVAVQLARPPDGSAPGACWRLNAVTHKLLARPVSPCRSHRYR